MIKGIILDFYRTLYIPELSSIPYSNMKLLKELISNGLILALLTKKEEGRRDLIKPIYEYFSVILEVDAKTESDFVTILSKLGCGEGEVLVVGDRIKSEIKVANKLGIKTIWYKSGKFRDELAINKTETPTYIVTDLCEILNIIRKENAKEPNTKIFKIKLGGN